MRSLVAEHFLVGAAEVVVIFTSGYFCRGGGGERVRCFCVRICEGSCINPFWEMEGPRSFSQKIS